MELIFSTLINGLSLGGIYAMIALGYTMVYGIAKMLNFAHGDVIMIGAYISFCAVHYWNLPPAVALVVAMLVCTVLGITIERLAYKPLRKATSLAVLITAIGVSYLLQSLAQIIFGSAIWTCILAFILTLAGQLIGELAVLVSGAYSSDLGTTAGLYFSFAGIWLVLFLNALIRAVDTIIPSAMAAANCNV